MKGGDGLGLLTASTDSTRDCGFQLFKRYYWLIPLLVFVTAIMIVGVVHETPFDEDFSYAWTVRHLLQTGEYKLHNWAAPNIRFQAYWGALFATLNSELFSGLRLSTAVLCGCAVVAFGFLARVAGCSRLSAVLAVVSLVACPFFLSYSVCFVSDGPFLALSLISLAVYSFAWRHTSQKAMFMASVVAGAAILTRQTGVVIPVAVGASWLLTKCRNQTIVLSVLGLTIPAVAVLWTVLDSGAVNSLGYRLTVNLQSEYYRRPLHVMLEQVWKVCMIGLYVTILVFPLSALAAITTGVRVARLRNRLFTSAPGRRWLWVLGLSAVVILSGLTYHKCLLHKSLAPPYLPWYWESLYGGKLNSAFASRCLLPIVPVCAALVGATLLREGLHQARCWWRGGQGGLLFWFTVLACGQLLAFYKLGDKYVLPFIPFVVLGLLRWCKPLISRLWGPFFSVCIIVILVQAVYLGNVLRLGAAQWCEAERLLESGISASEIAGDWQWISFHRYDEFAAIEWRRGDFGGVQRRFFQEWLPAQYEHAIYSFQVGHCNDFRPPEGWFVVHRTVPVSYIDLWSVSLRPVAVYTLKKSRP